MRENAQHGQGTRSGQAVADKSEVLMTRALAIGIDADSTYSAQILSQIGVPSVFMKNMRDGIGSGARVFFSKSALTDDSEALSGQRVAVITHHGSPSFRGRQKENVEARSYYFRIGNNSPFAPRSFYANMPVLQAEGESFGTCYDRGNNEIPNSGIVIIESDNRLIVSLPWDIGGYEQGAQWEHRPYFSLTARKHFVEVGPMMDSGAFRGLLLEILLYCFNWVGLPLVRVSPLYKNKKHFSFRIDADSFSQSSTEAGLRIAERTGLRFAWFLDMGLWKNRKEWITRLLEHNQDVQLHCFRHMTYASREVNDINIRKGLKEIRKSGITPNSIVSPMGYNYRGFSEAIKQLGFVFSSEFGYAVDDLPSRPWNDKNYPLQIPVHPACSGVFSEAGFSQDEQFSHFFDVVRERCNTDGICILYDHPIGGLETYEAQYIELFDKLIKSSYEYISMFDYYRAWIERQHNPRIVHDDEGQIHVDDFQENGFRLEQVTNGLCKPVRWKDVTLPQVKLQGTADEFPYPSEWIRDLAYKNGKSISKQRNFSKIKWHMHGLYLMLGQKTGYFQCRQSLARVGWLRKLRERIRG